jgi:hypothetical protein
MATYFKLNDDGAVIDIRSERPREPGWLKPRWITKFDEIKRLAEAATKFAGRTYVPVDHGNCRSPRYDVVRAPAVGDPVSYHNGVDTYPDGYVAHVTAETLRVVKTTTGRTYYRTLDGGSWLNAGGRRLLVDGHIFEQCREL